MHLDCLQVDISHEISSLIRFLKTAKKIKMLSASNLRWLKCLSLFCRILTFAPIINKKPADQDPQGFFYVICESIALNVII